MKSILEELFYGNVCPQEDCAISDEKTEQLKGFIAYHHTTLSSTLTDKQREIFDKFNECVSELTDIDKKDKYGQPYKDSEATIIFDLVHNDGEYTYAILILKDQHYLGKGEFEAIKAVIEDAFWLDFTFFICYNKGRICEEASRFAKFNEYVKWEMIDRLRF